MHRSTPPRLRVLALTAAASVGLAPWAVHAAADDGVPQLPDVEVITVGPLPGVGVPKDQLPANVQTLRGADIDRRHALALADHLSRTLGSVSLNAVQGNPFQPDLNFRGFTASPLLGTPQGVSVYLDGVRLNQPFGDVVSWDLIPRAAIASVALMPGSNPLFGLNTLGGALAVQTKDGLKNPGNSVQLLAGSHRRAAIEFESGGGAAELNWFVTGQRLHERGWRAQSPSGLSQLFAKLGTRVDASGLSLTAAFADNDLTGNGLQEQGAAERARASVYTAPDQTRNRAVFLNAAAAGPLGDTLDYSVNAYYRRISTRTSNGDINDAALTESVYQPDAAERAALAAAGYSGFPASGANAANTPFPKWRCIANVLLNDEPNDKCNGLVNRTATLQHNLGVTAQVSATPTLAGLEHRLLVGAGVDANRVRFAQSAQFGYVNPDRTVTPVAGPGAFADGSQDSDNAFDSRVDIASRAHSVSVFASDTVTLGPRTHLTLAGRYNRYRVSTIDALTPGGGAGSLDGSYRFSHFNPALGLTFAPTTGLTLYAGANQGSRAPSAVELGCADPASPCKLPNSFAGDPPLEQVVTTTFEAGLRGSATGRLAWNLGVFRSDNHDDLLFVSGNTSGFGYFRNFGKTRRQGLEAGLSLRPARDWTLGANVTLLDATYRSAERLGGSANSSNAAAAAGLPGQPGSIEIRAGDRIPLLPRRLLKLFADWDVTGPWRLGADLAASSGATARGNENGEHAPDGSYYTGPGRSAGYAVLNMNLDYRPSAGLAFFLQVNNLLDRRYASAAQLGANAFDANGNFIARALPLAANGEYPLRHGTFFAPGAPRGIWLGMRYAFGAAETGTTVRAGR